MVTSLLLRHFGRFLPAIFVFGMVKTASADMFVTPTRMNLSAEQRISQLKVRNDSTSTNRFQLRTMLWDQDKRGADKLTRTRDIIVTPPFITLGPGESQIVRVGMRRAVSRTKELNYRILISPVIKANRSGGSGFAIRQQISMPVMVAPSGPSAPSLSWTITRDQKVRVVNSGNASKTLVLPKMMIGGEAIWGLGSLVVLPGKEIHSSLQTRVMGGAPEIVAQEYRSSKTVRYPVSFE